MSIFAIFAHNYIGVVRFVNTIFTFEKGCAYLRDNKVFNSFPRFLRFRVRSKTRKTRNNAVYGSFDLQIFDLAITNRKNIPSAKSITNFQ